MGGKGDEVASSKQDGAGNDSVKAIAEFVRSGQLSSVALDTALGLALGIALCLISWYTFQLFESYVLIIVCAALVANALRPLRDSFFTSLTGAAPPVSDLQREREQKMSMYRNYKNLGMIAAVYVLLLVLRPMRAALFLALVASVSGTVFLAFVFMKMMYAFRAIGSSSAAAIMTMFTVVTVLMTFSSVFAIGIGQDVLSGIADASAFVVDAVKNDPKHQEFVMEKLQLAQDKALELSRANKASIDAAAAKVTELTGVDCSEYVAAAMAALEQDQLGKGGSSESVQSDDADAAASGEDSTCEIGEDGVEKCTAGAATAAAPAIDMDMLKEKAMEGFELLKPYIPKSAGEAKELVAQARAQLETVDVEKYREIASDAAQKVASGLASMASSLGGALGSIKTSVSFALLVFLLVSMECSAVSLVTDLLPFPRRVLNETVELDIRMALSAMVWGVIRFFALHLLFVWMAFSALGLNFEYLASLLAGLSAALPFLPPPFVIPFLFAAPQLIARREWAQLVALPLAHVLLGNDRNDYLQSIRQHMTVGVSILNDELLTMASVLGAAVFGQKGIIVAPLLITFSLVLYDIFALINKQDQMTRERLIIRDDEYHWDEPSSTA